MKLSVEKNKIFFCYTSYFKVLPISFQKLFFFLLSSIKQKKSSALLKFDSVKSALHGKIYSLKPLRCAQTLSGCAQTPINKCIFMKISIVSLCGHYLIINHPNVYFLCQYLSIPKLFVASVAQMEFQLCSTVGGLSVELYTW